MYALLLIMTIALLCGVRPHRMFGALAIGGLLGLVWLFGIQADSLFSRGVSPNDADMHVADTTTIVPLSPIVIVALSVPPALVVLSFFARSLRLPRRWDRE